VYGGGTAVAAGGYTGGNGAAHKAPGTNHAHTKGSTERGIKSGGYGDTGTGNVQGGTGYRVECLGKKEQMDCRGSRGESR